METVPASAPAADSTGAGNASAIASATAPAVTAANSATTDVSDTTTGKRKRPAKLAQKRVTFKVNDVKPSGKSVRTISRADLLTEVKLIDPGACSKHPRGFIFQKELGNGFIEAVTFAFDGHFPLSLRPEHFWALVLQGVVSHINDKDNAESLRSKFVKHKEKMILRVDRDSFQLGKAGNDWAGVVAEFDQQISSHVVPDAAKAMEMRFSTTTADEKTCGAVAVMSAMQKFFTYKMRTKCGFPSITLEGSLADWQLLRHKAEELVSTRCLPSFSKRWLPAMLPVLDRFVRQYQRPKDVDVNFWQCMCKRGGLRGSGGYSWLNGWFNVFMPYLNHNAPNRYCVPYSDDIGYAKEGLYNDNYYEYFGGPMPKGAEGPDTTDMANGILSAPVEWNYLGKIIELQFVSGFVGMETREDGAVAPVLGWHIQHKTPPKKPKVNKWGYPIR